MFLSAIYIYPVKSLGGISLQSSVAQGRGLLYDRRWMIVDESNCFVSQRTIPEMALIGTALSDEGIELYSKVFPENKIFIPFGINSGESMLVNVWSDTCEAIHFKEEVDSWLSDLLQTSCKLVYMPDSTMRLVEQKFSINDDITSFADGFPFLLIGNNSLHELNKRLDDPISMNRFRPNFVFEGGEPFVEDSWDKFYIGDVLFKAVKPCSRCTMITVNQEDATQGKEPLTALSKFRKKNNQVYFGQNLLAIQLGNVFVGDKISMLNEG